MGGDDLNDFDFNSVIADKEEAKKGGNDEFNFGFDDAQPKSSAAPKQSSNAVPDLMDLLGGDMP